MTDTEVELIEIKETLKRMQAQIDRIVDKIKEVNPQCFWQTVTAANPDCYNPIFTEDMPLSLSAAKSLWPYLENEFDRYCTEHNITTWTPTDSENFYNEYVGVGADWPNENSKIIDLR